MICVPRRVNSFSFNDDKTLVDGYAIPYFIEKVITNKQKEIEDTFTMILRDIKTSKKTNKETLKKLKAYNKMFKGVDYKILDSEIKGIGVDLRNRQRKCEMALEEGLLLAKMFGNAKRKNIKIKAKLESLGETK